MVIIQKICQFIPTGKNIIQNNQSEGRKHVQEPWARSLENAVRRWVEFLSDYMLIIREISVDA